VNSPMGNYACACVAVAIGAQYIYVMHWERGETKRFYFHFKPFSIFNQNARCICVCAENSLKS
jgi:hypothetical protein